MVMNTDDYTTQTVTSGKNRTNYYWSSTHSYLTYWAYEPTIAGYRGFIYDTSTETPVIIQEHPSRDSLSISGINWFNNSESLLYTSEYPSNFKTLYASQSKTGSTINRSETAVIDQHIDTFDMRGDGAVVLAARNTDDNDHKIYLVNGGGAIEITQISSLNKRIFSLAFSKSGARVLVRMPRMESPYLVDYHFDTNVMQTIKTAPEDDRSPACFVIDVENQRNCQLAFDYR